MKTLSTHSLAIESELASRPNGNPDERKEENSVENGSERTPFRTENIRNDLPPEAFSSPTARLFSAPLPGDVRPDITGGRPVLARGSQQIAECLRTFLAQKRPNASRPFILELSSWG